VVAHLVQASQKQNGGRVMKIYRPKDYFLLASVFVYLFDLFRTVYAHPLCHTWFQV
jgi:hypothetical protein